MRLFNSVYYELAKLYQQNIHFEIILIIKKSHLQFYRYYNLH